MSKRFSAYLGILLALYLLLFLWMVQRPLENDFSIFYGSARHVLEGRGLYEPVEIERFQTWDPDEGPNYRYLLPNLNPPFLTLLVLPLSLLSYPTAFWTWSLLSLLAGMAAMLVLEKETRTEGASPERRLGFLLLLLAYYPTWINIQYGQLGLFLFLLLVVAWSRLRRGDSLWGGVLLGLAVAVKLFVALFALFLLARKRLPALIWLGAAFLACWLAAGVALGFDSLLEYRAQLGVITWSAASWNASFLGFFSRLLGGSEGIPLWDAPGLGRLLSAICAAGSAVLLVLLAWPRDGQSKAAADLGFGLTIVLMLLLSPLGWAYYFSVLLLPLVLAWIYSGDLAARTRFRAGLIAAGLLCAAPLPLLDAAEIDSNLDRLLLSGVYFYGLVLLAALLGWLVLQDTRKRRRGLL